MVEKELTESILLGWNLDLTLDSNGNIAIDDELAMEHFQVLRKDNELRSYIDQKINEREQTIKNQLLYQLELTQKFDQWWRNLDT